MSRGAGMRPRRRSPFRRARRRCPASRCRRRTASSACSAITTTIATCRRRWRHEASRCCKDARTRLTISGEALDLIGIRYWTTRARDIALVARGAATASILLAHNPSRLKEAAALALPLMLSGHTHGGQIVLPGIGAIAARNFPIVAGQGSRDTTTAFVSRGVGTVYVPVRVNCPPEVAILTLKPAVTA